MFKGVRWRGVGIRGAGGVVVVGGGVVFKGMLWRGFKGVRWRDVGRRHGVMLGGGGVMRKQSRWCEDNSRSFGDAPTDLSVVEVEERKPAGQMSE